MNDNLKIQLVDLGARKEAREYIDPAEAFVGVDWTADNSAYFGKIIAAKIVTRADVTAAMREQKIIAALGELPSTPRHFVNLIFRNHKVTTTYKGAVTIDGNDQRSILDLARLARMRAVELGIAWGRSEIDDAVEQLYIDRRDAALTRVLELIEPRQSFDWDRLVRNCFGPDDVAFNVAVLRKHIWQVKRKLHGLPVSNHLMAVICGAQGKGKSYFIELLHRVIAELVSSSNFDAITDDRNIDLWRSFVVVLDEMAKAGKADIETTKNVITAPTLERRPMRTNNTITIKQNATFIGSTNFSVAELIRDDTGNRRFAQLDWAEPEFGFLDEFDFLSAWRSVHQSDADPMSEFTETLTARQAAARNTGPVESWLADMTADDWRNLDEVADDRFITIQPLFDSYMTHRSIVNGGQEREHRTRNQFAHELSRICGNGGETGLERKRTSTAKGYRLCHPSLGPVLAIYPRGGAR